MKPEVIVTDNQLPREVIKAIKGGRKIEAIKILRDETGIGLANAKVLVDRAWRIHGPAKASPPTVIDYPIVRNLAKSVFLGLILVGVYYFYLKS